jgi:uroporphyrinogen decarboxylase
MTKRENIIKILKRQGGEYIPLSLDFAGSLHRDFIEKHGDVSISDHYDLDFRRVGIGPATEQHDFSGFYSGRSLREGTEVSADGVANEPGDFEHFTHMVSPLAGREVSVQEIEEYPLEDTAALDRYKGVAGRVDQLHADGYAVMGGPGHTFERAWAVRGMQEMLIDFYENQEVAHALCERIHRMNMFMTEEFAADGVDIMLFGDDVGTQNGMMFSPEIWREFFKDRLAKQIAKAKEMNPGIVTWYHSDGDIGAIIPELIEIGLDILNPVQPECLDPVEMKEKYGDSLAFWGTIGTQSVMPFGTPHDVRETVKRMIDKVGYDGGLLLAPTHCLEPEVPWDNINAFVETVRDFGKL